MAKLRHPNVVSVFEVGEHRGEVYVAMEEIKGGTLRDVLRQLDVAGDHGWRARLDLFAEAARELVAAHERGLVH